MPALHKLSQHSINLKLFNTLRITQNTGNKTIQRILLLKKQKHTQPNLIIYNAVLTKVKVLTTPIH